MGYQAQLNQYYHDFPLFDARKKIPNVGLIMFNGDLPWYKVKCALNKSKFGMDVFAKNNHVHSLPGTCHPAIIPCTSLVHGE